MKSLNLFLLFFALFTIGCRAWATSSNVEKHPPAIPWIKNTGQWNKDILFTTHTFSGNVYVNAQKEIFYALPVDSLSGWVLKERFSGRRTKLTGNVKGTVPAKTTINYFTGNDKNKWQTNIPVFEDISLGEIWAGITVKLKAHQDNIEKICYVSPHTDPDAIQITVDGCDKLTLGDNGKLIAHTTAGRLAFSPPIAYQYINGKKHFAKAGYKISKEKNTYSFLVEDYNPEYELIIDPLLASTFIGDGGNDWGNAIAIDEEGAVFVTGYAWSDNFPTTPGAYDASFNGVKDAFVAKLSNDLSELLVSTFIGGSSWDNGLSIAIEPSGTVIISGATGSTNFPINGTAYDNSHNGGSNDVFVCKLPNDLSSIIVSTFIGGGDDDYGYDLALDDSGNIFITGRTESTDYPATGYDNSFNGGFEDVFVTKLNNDLSVLLGSTFIGGASDEGADAITVDDAGNVFVTGFTYSDDFPTAGSPIDATHNGSGDIFIAKFDNNLTGLLAGTFIGGSNYEESHAIAIDATQNIFIAGYTGSPEYPVTPGVFDAVHNGNHDAVITKVDNSLSTILAGTFIGGGEDDDCYGLVIEGAENVFITGHTFSGDYPVTPNAYDDTHHGIRDIFVSRFSFDLTELLESTYLGGGNNDWSLDLDIDATGSVFIAGGTYSSDFPIEGNPYDDSFNGKEDVIVAKIAGCGVNDLCDPSKSFGAIFLDVEQDTACNNGCNATATPGPTSEGGCFDFPNATVWYYFKPEQAGNCIKINIESEDLPQPQIAVFSGDCPEQMQSLPFACNTGSGGAVSIHMGVQADTTYYIAVSDVTGAEGYFTICIENEPSDGISLDIDAHDLQCNRSSDGSIETIVNNATGFVQFDWNINALDGTANPTGLDTGLYFVTITDENDCTVTSDSIILHQPDSLWVNLHLEPDDSVLVYGDSVLITTTLSTGENAISHTIWSPNDILSDTTQNIILQQYAKPLESTEVTVIVTDSTGCTATDKVRLLVHRNFPFYLPNIFAPESDNPYNNVFRPFYSDKIKKINYLKIFNRWGALIYKKYNLPVFNENIGWDGTFNGKSLNSGVFVFSIEVEFIDGSVEIYSGDVTLVR